MTTEETVNEQVWEILQDIKEEILSTVKGNPVKYTVNIHYSIIGTGAIPSDRKINILYKLEEEKAFEIQKNFKGNRIGIIEDAYKYDIGTFYLIIDQKKFEEIYKNHKNLVEKETNQASESSIRLTKKELRKKFNQTIETKQFGKKEKALLKFLAEDFQPKTIDEIIKKVSTKDYKHLKASVQKKIKGTEFHIKTIKANSWSSKAHYQLEFLPRLESKKQ